MSISPEVQQWLLDRAAALNCSVDELAARLLESEQNYRLVVDHVTDLVTRHSLDGRFRFVTPSVQRILGFAPDELIGRSVLDFLHPEDHPKLRLLQTQMRTHAALTMECRFLRRDGSHVWLETTCRLNPSAHREHPREITAVSRPITQRKQTEYTLRQSEARLQTLVESQTAFVVRTDLQGRITYANPAWVKKFWGAEESFIGRSTLESILPEDHAATQAAAAQCLQTPGEPVQVILRKPSINGTLIWTLWEFVAVRGPEGAVAEVQCMGFDVTEQHAAEAALRASESRFRLLLESASGAIVVLGQRGRIVLVNRRAEEMFGYERDELLGQGIEALIPARFHGQHRQHQTTYMAHPHTRPLGHNMDLVARHKDGREFPVEVGLSHAPADDGMLVMSYITDITERRQAEEIRLEQERLKASLRKEREFNSRVQRTISALSHDIRTPLTVISTTRDMLDQYFDRMSEEKRREKLNSIGRQLHYVLELLEDMTLVVKGSLDHTLFRPETLNLAALCKVSLNEIQASTGTHHRLQFVSDGQVELARVDETLVSRILLNLLSNAIKFTPDQGEIRLELSRRDRWIVLRVIDHGIGIAADELQQIFAPFYRGANARMIGGTGLGLNIVKECVARHQGEIGVESELGQGTRFTVELPYLPG